MGTVTIQRFTYKNPISMIGEEAGICWGADTSNPKRIINEVLTVWKVSMAEPLSSPMFI